MSYRPSPALDRSASERALPALGLGEQDRACEERERVRDQAGSRLEQPLTRVERGLEDLFLERFVADDLGNQQVGRFRQLDLSRPAGKERHPVLHAVHLEHPRGDPCDVARLDGIDASSTRSSCSHGEDPAPRTDVEHDVVRADGGGQCGQVVIRAAVVVEHARMLDRVGPSARRSSARLRHDEGALLDEHVDDAHRRREVGGATAFAFELFDRVAQRQRLREQRQDGESPRPDVDDGPDRRIDQHVTRCRAPRANPRRELQHGVRGQGDVVQGCRTSRTSTRRANGPRFVQSLSATPRS